VSDGTVDPARVRQHLVTRLPEYLVPSRLTLLPRIPLTPDGGYDLSALPQPAGDDARP
jgi:acyl-CoA synthetase (AMP-forming)/AMP-acid ligase II